MVPTFFRLLAQIHYVFDQPAVKSLRVLRFIKLVTGIPSKWVATQHVYVCIYKHGRRCNTKCGLLITADHYVHSRNVSAQNDSMHNRSLPASTIDRRKRCSHCLSMATRTTLSFTVLGQRRYYYSAGIVSPYVNICMSSSKCILLCV